MIIPKKKQNSFSKKLLKWHICNNNRIMPWLNEKDTYKIWISEIILQQTRVEQGTGYYNRFIEKFPDLRSLALANDEDVFKLWEGLGYYSRCKNLIHTAKWIYYELDGKFPQSYEGLMSLKGIGPYTAAAIASFAFGLPYAVVDGNVFRVLARYFGQSIPIDSSEGKMYFSTLANLLIDKNDPASYNQGIMDFGATVCKPKVPECQHCVLQPDCVAFHTGVVNKLPIKEKQLVKRRRFFTYFIFIVNSKVLISKRTEKDIWENLYEFYLFESNNAIEWKGEELNSWLTGQMGISTFEVEHISSAFKQQLTHQNLEGRFITIKLDSIPASLKHYKSINISDLQTIAFPKFINQYLEGSDKFEIIKKKRKNR